MEEQKRRKSPGGEKIEKLTKEDILREFPGIHRSIKDQYNNNNNDSKGEEKELNGYDAEQVRLMSEECIVVDYNDNIVGGGSKKMCHLMKNIDNGLLHRAFSVFLFDSKDRLLLQKRADEKITFPGMWTNTCCSHPLFRENEVDSIDGAKFAAIRKLQHELGINSIDIPSTDAFHFITRIHYLAPCGDGSVWGEHEIDYILIIKLDHHTIDINPNEVSEIAYVDANQLKSMFNDKSLQFTPWFKLISNSYLFNWWENLDNLHQFQSNSINRLL